MVSCDDDRRGIMAKVPESRGLEPQTNKASPSGRGKYPQITASAPLHLRTHLAIALPRGAPPMGPLARLHRPPIRRCLPPRLASRTLQPSATSATPTSSPHRLQVMWSRLDDVDWPSPRTRPGDRPASHRSPIQTSRANNDHGRPPHPDVGGDAREEAERKPSPLLADRSSPVRVVGVAIRRAPRRPFEGVLEHLSQ